MERTQMELQNGKNVIFSEKVAHWNADICIQCGNCSFVCPHSVIRSKFYHKDLLTEVPEGFQSAPINARGFPETKFTLQVYEEDCTGCRRIATKLVQ